MIHVMIIMIMIILLIIMIIMIIVIILARSSASRPSAFFIYKLGFIIKGVNYM